MQIKQISQPTHDVPAMDELDDFEIVASPANNNNDPPSQTTASSTAPENAANPKPADPPTPSPQAPVVTDVGIIVHTIQVLLKDIVPLDSTPVPFPRHSDRLRRVSVRHEATGF